MDKKLALVYQRRQSPPVDMTCTDTEPRANNVLPLQESWTHGCPQVGVKGVPAPLLGCMGASGYFCITLVPFQMVMDTIKMIHPPPEKCMSPAINQIILQEYGTQEKKCNKYTVM